MESNNLPQEPVQNPSLQFSSSNQQTKSKQNKMLIVIFIIGGLCILLLLILVVLTIQKPNALFNNGSSLIPKSLTNTPSTPTPTIDPVSNGTPDTKDFTFKIDKVIPNPPVIGYPPDQGMQYLEIDLTATYTGNIAEYVPGIFYYMDTSGILGESMDLQHPDRPHQSLTIPNKKSLYQTKFLPGMSVSGLYLLYQIKPGDHGKLLWMNPKNPDKSKQRMTFTLF